MTESNAQIMEEYYRVVNEVQEKLPLGQNYVDILLRPDSEIFASDLGRRAREVWARAAEACDNPAMAAFLRSADQAEGEK